MEGGPMILTCEMWLPPRKPDVQIQFCFFRDVQMLGSGCKSSPELRITTVWNKDSGSYWCQAQIVTLSLTKTSLMSQIHVQRVPVSDVSLETQPPGGQVMEGDKLVLICSVASGTGDITFFWYRGALGSNLETKTQRSLTAEFEIALVQQKDAEQYYCAADNGHGPSLSGLISITVRSPVSRPVLTFRTPRAQTVVGDVVELHCEAPRGSPPILYQLYQEDVILGNSLAPSGGGVSFNLSLTTEHSGNYSCEADNGRPAQRSEVVTLNVTVSHGCIWDIQMLFQTDRICFCICRSPASPVPQQSNYRNSPDSAQLQTFYENVNAVSGDKVYSLVYHNQQERDPVAASHHSCLVAAIVALPMAGPEKLRDKKALSMLGVERGGSPEAQVVVGDIVELHCEAPRGSPPILYRFYHENVTLGSSSAPLAGGASFKLLLNTEHAGNYSCEADNGLGAQHSEVMALIVIGISRSRTGPATAGVIGGLLGLVVTAALLYHFRTRRKSGGTLAPGTPSPIACQEPSSSRPSTIDPEEPVYSESPALMDLQPVYSNVNPGNTNLLSSHIQTIQHTNGNQANSPRLHREDKEPEVIYSEVKAHLDEFAKQTSKRESVHEDAAGNCENVSCASAASDH
ncbi:Fc receptor-like protein 1 [Heterocephalus glaber]|uniref:Fc receptor-like protein 1 n=1 Tax=Heterocephalus glaber TaxID=10181 RepID=G5BSX1_HETGA|nr:Fc receptor-like protein 1 [Heterocephalus glaber]